MSSLSDGCWTVGASLLAMVANVNAGSLTPRGVLGFIASKLAPTGVVDVGYKAFILDIAPSGA
ncbi:hypothetical protein EMIT0196MI5_30146 [Pseudomonas sp. IT-196MI5]